MIRDLVPHKVSSISPSPWHLETSTEASAFTLDILYRVKGDLSTLEIPDHALTPSRADNLWQSTCFEIFLRRKDQPQRYLEFNFAPNGHWALYRFSDYRKDLERPLVNEPPVTSIQIQAENMALAARIPWSLINDLLAGTSTLEAAISVILKEKDGELAYWAVKHPLDRPDFHHPDSFVALSLTQAL